MRHGQRPVSLADAEGREDAGDGRSPVDAPDGVGHPPDGRRFVDGPVGDSGADDEARHQVALRPDKGQDLRADTDPRCGNRRRVLDLAADAQEVRVVAAEANDDRSHSPGLSRA